MITSTLRVNSDVREPCVRYLMLESELVLTIEVIPDLDPTVLGDNEEDTWACWGPATVGKIRMMELSPDNRCPELLVPDLRGPITNSQEVLRELVPLASIYRSKMSSTFKTVPEG